MGGASGGNHDDETASGGIKGQMNILDQVLHSDCRPVLEFSMVSCESGKFFTLVCQTIEKIIGRHYYWKLLCEMYVVSQKFMYGS